LCVASSLPDSLSLSAVDSVSAHTTCAPSLENRSAIARPIPDDEPVTLIFCQLTRTSNTGWECWIAKLSVTYTATLFCSLSHEPLFIIVEKDCSYRCVTCWSLSSVILKSQLVHGSHLFGSEISYHASRSLCNSRCISTRLQYFSDQMGPVQSSKSFRETRV
jgi:hypothetical protein